MNCWNILGIEPTADKKMIRKAYSQKLKATRPDEDAVGYQRLREAYDEALYFAESFEKPIAEIADIYTEDNSSFFNKEESDSNIINLSAYLYTSIDEFMRHWFQIYNTFGDSGLLIYWEGIRTRLDNLPRSDVKQIEQKILAFISTKRLDNELIEMLSKYFNWHQKEEPIFISKPLTQSKSNIVEYLSNIYNKVGEDAILVQWDSILIKLESLDFFERDEVSLKILTFLFDFQITNPFLWKRFSDYFEWQKNLSIGDSLRVEEFELFNLFIQSANILEKNEKESEYNITGLLHKYFYRSSKKLHKLKTVLMGIYLYSDWKKELVFDEWRWKYIKKLYEDMDSIHRLSRNISILGIVCFVICIFSLTPEFFTSVADTKESFIFFSFLAFPYLYFFITTIASYFSFIFGKFYDKIIHFTWTNEYWLRIRFLSIILITPFLLERTQLIYIALIYAIAAPLKIILCQSNKILYFSSSFFYFTVGLSTIGLCVLLKDISFIFGILVLSFWINLTTYLNQFTPLGDKVDLCIKTASRTLNPIALIISGFLYIVMLPALTIRNKKYLENITTFTITIISCYWLDYLYLKQGLLFFYPIWLIITAIKSFITSIIIKQLKKEA